MASRGPLGSRRGASSFWRFVREHPAPSTTGQKPFGAGAADARDTGACWEWQGSHDLCGYGRFSMGGRTILAHRHAWELVNGPIPEGLVIWHACGNFACVRPDHLEALPRAEQRLRSKRAMTPERFWQRVKKLPDPPTSGAASSPRAETAGETVEEGASGPASEGAVEGAVERANERALSGCWLWRGRVTSWGYGELAARGKRLSAHRYAYTITYGALPDEVELLHRCGNPRCVRPDHLAPASRKAISQHHWQAVTHCPHGHPRTPENLYTTPKGVQLCRLCHNARMRRYHAKRREQQRAVEASDQNSMTPAPAAPAAGATQRTRRRGSSTR